MKTCWSTLITNNSLNVPYISRTIFHKFGFVFYARMSKAKTRPDIFKAKAEARANKIGFETKVSVKD